MDIGRLNPYPYKVYKNSPPLLCVLAIGRCVVVLEGERMEELKEFKCLEMLCKHGEMEGEIRVVKGSCVIR